MKCLFYFENKLVREAEVSEKVLPFIFLVSENIAYKHGLKLEIEKSKGLVRICFRL